MRLEPRQSLDRESDGNPPEKNARGIGRSDYRQYLDRIGEAFARDSIKQAGDDELLVRLTYTTDRSLK